MHISARLRRTIVLPFALLLFFALAAIVSAHPLGNFTINHYARLEPSANVLRVRYVLDYAEIPTFQEKQNMDTDSNGDMSPAEISAYLAERMPVLLQNLKLTVNQRPIALQLEPNSAQLEFLPGQGGLEIMHVSAWLRAPFAVSSAGDAISFQDTNYTERLGWREIVARASTSTEIKNANVSDKETSQELTTYPADMLSNPLNQRQATFTVLPGAGSATSSTAAPATVDTSALGIFDRTRDDFAKLITTQDALSPTVLLLSLLAAMALGAVHAFSPGHGKAVVGAYLVGSRGNWQHAVFLGLVVTATHTAGVYALGAVTLFLSAYIFPDQLLPWLGFISGMLVAVIGIRLFIERLRAARKGDSAFDRAVKRTPARGSRGKAAQAGLTYAYAPGKGSGSMSAAEYSAALNDHPMTPGHSHVFATPEEEAAHACDHLAEIQTLEKPTWKNLLSLGISGGLLPCPSALVVMLSAIALGRVLYGLYLIIGFSVGLAGVLVLTGLALLYLGRAAGRMFAGERVSWFMRYVPIVGAGFVALLGIGIAFDAVFQTGLIR